MERRDTPPKMPAMKTQTAGEHGQPGRARGTQKQEVESTLHALAARQHGVVTRSQLLRAGIAADVVDRRLESKRLRALHRGVYLVGPLLSVSTRAMAAALAFGESAAVSHRSAATLWRVLAGGEGEGMIDVNVARSRRRREGVRVHRVRTLRPDEVTTLDAIPLTTPERTLYDLASTVEARELEQALAEALAKDLTNQTRVLALVSRYAGRPGTARLRALLASEAQPALARSQAEESFLGLIRKAQLPRPEVNVVVGRYEVDFYWRAQRFAAEIDGFAFHSSQRSFESDRRRDAVLAAAGVRVMRVTWRQIVSEPEAMLVRLGQALIRAGTAP